MENVDEKPPLPPPRKYISIFHLDGEPILPPLMTAEKRRKMQILKEKALLVEQRLSVHNYQKLDKNVENIKHNKSDIDREESFGNISKPSQGNDYCRFKETEESIDLLTNLLIKQLEENKSGETLEMPCSSLIDLNKNKSQEKLLKLQKSETLIYDHSTNQVVKVPNENVKIVDDIHRKRATNIGNSQNKNRIHLLLAGTTTKGSAAIPAICLNPPTPLTVDKNLCDSLSAAESSESIITSENPNQSLYFSSDESCNGMITHSDKNLNRSIRQNDTKQYKSDDSSSAEKNVSAKIQQFEAISSDTNTPETSPEKVSKIRKLCIGTLSGSLQRQ